MTIDKMPEILTVRETAAFLRVSTTTLKRWEKKGHLMPMRINSRGDRRYKKEEILFYLGVSERNQ